MPSAKTSVSKNTSQETGPYFSRGSQQGAGAKGVQAQRETAPFSLPQDPRMRQSQDTAALAGTWQCGHWFVDSRPRTLLSKRWTLLGELKREFNFLSSKASRMLKSRSQPRVFLVAQPSCLRCRLFRVLSRPGQCGCLLKNRDGLQKISGFFNQPCVTAVWSGSNE